MTEASVDLKETYYKAKRDLLRTLVEEYPGKSERGPMTEASVDIGYLQLSCTTCTVYMRRRIHVICTVYMRRRHLSQSLIRSLYSAIRPLYSVSRSLYSGIRSLYSAIRSLYSAIRPLYSVSRSLCSTYQVHPVPLPSRTSEEEDTCMSYEEEDTKVSIPSSSAFANI